MCRITVLPNGMIANLSGPYEARKHDSTMLYESGLLLQLQQKACYNSEPLYIYMGNQHIPSKYTFKLHTELLILLLINKHLIKQ